MTDPTSTRRRFYPTPAWLVLGLLVVEGLLWLSERFGWPAWHKGYAVLSAVAGVGVVLGVMLVWWVAALVFHLRFQFSIRSLLVLTVAVALPCSWFGVELKKAREQRQAVDAIETWGGPMAAFVGYDYNYDAKSMNVSNRQTERPEWLRNLVGDDFLRIVIYISFSSSGATDETFEHFMTTHSNDLPKLEALNLACTPITNNGLKGLGKLRNLRSLDLSSTQITAEGLRYLQGLSRLEDLQLYSTQIGDKGSENLNLLTQLKSLNLQGCPITDAGMQGMIGLTQLKQLNLSMTRITDKGIRYLNKLVSLRELELWDTNVTDAGVMKLQQALPNCKIIH